MASHKLKKLQTIRRIEREEPQEQLFDQAVAAELNNINFAEQSQSPAFGGKLETRNPKPVPFDKLRAGSERSRRDARDTSGACADDFAKQSQFAPGLMGSTSFMKRDYDDTTHPETAGNKANGPAQLFNSRGQSLSPPKGVSKGELDE